MLILADANMRFSTTEMNAIDPDGLNQAVALPDEGYFGSLTVFHELHCVVSVVTNALLHDL